MIGPKTDCKRAEACTLVFLLARAPWAYWRAMRVMQAVGCRRCWHFWNSSGLEPLENPARLELQQHRNEAILLGPARIGHDAQFSHSDIAPFASC